MLLGGEGEGVGTRPTLHWRYCTFLLYMRTSLLLVVLFLKWERDRKKEKENVRSSVWPVALAGFCNVSGLRWLRHSPMDWYPGVCTPPGTICLVFCVLYTYIIVFFIFMRRFCSKKDYEILHYSIEAVVGHSEVIVTEIESRSPCRKNFKLSVKPHWSKLQFLVISRNHKQQAWAAGVLEPHPPMTVGYSNSGWQCSHI